jgi:cytoskeleton protein RodZ
MAKGNFGERLKRERELRDVSLGEVTKGTRIGRRFLEALEEEEWDKLPGGVFSRGFVRSIARYLGLSEEDLLSEYDLARGEPNISAPAPYENQLPSPSRLVPALALLFIVLLCVGGFYAGRNALHRYTANRDAHPPATSTRTQPPSDSGVVAKPPDKLELTVSTSVPSHVRIAADDQVLLDSDILPGDVHHFTAAQQFQINAADGSAVHLELNGRPITSSAGLSNSPGGSDTIILGYKDLRPSHDGTSRP